MLVNVTGFFYQMHFMKIKCIQEQNRQTYNYPKILPIIMEPIL